VRTTPRGGSGTGHGDVAQGELMKQVLTTKDKVVYYESRKRELKKRRKNEHRYDERLKTKSEEGTCFGYTGLYEELEHLKIQGRTKMSTHNVWLWDFHSGTKKAVNDKKESFCCLFVCAE